MEGILGSSCRKASYLTPVRKASSDQSKSKLQGNFIAWGWSMALSTKDFRLASMAFADSFCLRKLAVMGKDLVMNGRSCLMRDWTFSFRILQ